jgi:cation-transporting P-type ATPase E
MAGLTEQEVAARRQAGLGNNAVARPGRTYGQIIRYNLFTIFNNILFGIGVALIAMGRLNDAVTSVGLGLVNALISTVQEVRAKRQLDKIALLTTPKITAIRDGRNQAISPEELVKDDLIQISPGDQIVVDGPLTAGGPLEIDESLLTGEPNLIRKQGGDQLLSGSFCVTGTATMTAEKVGADSYANQLTTAARRFQVTLTPLQRQTDFLVRLVMLVVAVMSIIILVAGLLEGLSTLRLVQITAVLSGQVPYGLFFMIVVAYTLGAAKMARQGALVQQVNAIESLSNIDVLCLDKTGTLTANRLVFHDLVPLGEAAANGVDAETVRARLGDFAHSVTNHNQTSQTLQAAVPGQRRPLVAEVPFASARKWSGVAFDEPDLRGCYVLGAIEVLIPHLVETAVTPESPLVRQSQQWAGEGLRLLLLAGNPDVIRLHNEAGDPQLPPLTPLALVSLRDELRPEAAETLQAFHRLGLDLKIISGDNPQTVAALARQANWPGELRLVTGTELATMNPQEFDRTAVAATIFGRIQPEQKEQLIDALLRQGRRVAMMGDGLNDVWAIKKATLGIAMESGSSAARNIADMILLQDSFAVLRPAFAEGQRIIGGMVNALYLFLARVVAGIFIIVAVTMIGLDFPFDPAQLLLMALAVGIPALFLTLWARPQRLEKNLLTSVARFVLPAGIVTMLLGTALYVTEYNTLLGSRVTSEDVPAHLRQTFESYTGVPFGDEGYRDTVATVLAQGSLSLFLAWTSCLLILFLEPPSAFFLAWRQEISPDKRPALLAVVLILLFLSTTLFPSIGYYFGVLKKPPGIALLLLALALLWLLIMRAIWRLKLFERFLGLG